METASERNDTDEAKKNEKTEDDDGDEEGKRNEASHRGKLKTKLPQMKSL